MKVYRATVQVSFYVAAEDDDDAQDVAEWHASDAVSDSGFLDVDLTEIRSDRMCGADPGTAPYGEDGRTIGEILANPEPLDPDAEPEPVKDVWTVPMFPEPPAEKET